MTAPNARFVEGKKFLWDGRVYSSPEDAARARAQYESEGFETCTCEDGGAHLVYTRRVVKQVSDEKQD
jgi:hypothetical protein